MLNLPTARRRPRFAVLATTVVALLALSGSAAGSASAAEWHVNKKPLAGGWQQIATWVGGAPQQIEMTVPGRNILVTCYGQIDDTPNEKYVGTSSIYDYDKLDVNMKYVECSMESLSTGNPVPCQKVEDKGDSYHLFSGTGAQIKSSSTALFQFKAGTGCPIPLNQEVTIPSITLTYTGVESWAPLVTGTGEGKWGAFPMTVSGGWRWMVLTGGTVYGWY